MSEPSKPRRRITLTLPPGLVAPSATEDEREWHRDQEPATREETAQLSTEPPTPSVQPPSAAPQTRPRRRLQLTAPTWTSPELPPPEEPVLGAKEESVSTPQTKPSPEEEPPKGPPRRLLLTLPTDGRRGPRKWAERELVTGTYRIPKKLVEALEEEWWRRQAEGEGWSRSEIVAASLAEGLADPERLSEALKHLDEGETP